jgi:hypothetical protein
MNIHIIEPYNAWAPKNKKKTFQQEIFEQNQRVEELAQIFESQNRVLQQVTAPTQQATVAGYAAPAGAGGTPTIPELLVSNININRIPAAGAAPLTVQFYNLVPNRDFYRYKWVFGDGTTSNELDPIHVYDSGSAPTYGYSASLEVSSSTNAPIGRSPVYLVTLATPPSVTASFTFTTSSKSVPSITTFVNTTINTSQTPTTTYLWNFGSGSLTSTAANPAPVSYLNAGSYTASLQATGSYGLRSLYTGSWRVI